MAVPRSRRYWHGDTNDLPEILGRLLDSIALWSRE